MSYSKIKLNKTTKKALSLIAIGLIMLYCINLAVYAKEISDKKTVIVGTIRGFTSGKDDEPNSASEYASDYLNEIAKHTDWNYKYHAVGLVEGLDMLENGELDLFGPLQYSKERAQKFDFPDIEFGYEQSALYVSVDNNNVFYEDYKAFNGLKVGLVEGNYNNAAFDDYCGANQFDVSKYYYDDVSSLMKAIREQEVDMIAVSCMIEDDGIKMVGEFAVEKYYYVTKKGNAEMLHALNRALHKINIENPYFHMLLFNRYYADNKIGFTRQEYEFIQNNTILNVVGDPNWEPLEFYDTSLKTQAGINIDILKAIAQNAGIKFNFIKTNNYQESIEMIQNGKADLISGNVNMVSDQLVKKTDVYQSTPIALVGKTNTLLKEQYRIALLNSGAEEINSFFRDQAGAQPVYYDTLHECIKAVQKGEADMTLMSVHIYDMFAKKGEYKDIKIIRTADVSFDIRFGVSTQLDSVAYSVINKAINNLTQKQIDEAIIGNTVNKGYAMTWIKLVSQYYMFFIFAFMIIVYMLFFINSHQKSKHAKKMREIAYTDPLTGSGSMEKFKEDCKELLSKFNREDFSLLYFDVDKFKYVNDTFGYHIGNEVLRHISNCIQETIYDYEIFSRLSGDIFVVMIKNIQDKQIVEIINKLVRNIQLQPHMQKASHKLIVCFGIYKFTKSDEDVFIAIDKANMARKTVKGSHESSYSFYDESMHQQFIHESEIAGTMRIALQQREFELYLQPKIDLTTQKIAGAEALVRWNHSKRGIIPPIEFLPVLERNGFITEIDFFIFEETCKTLRHMMDEGYSVNPISVNLSRVHMRSAKFINRLTYIAKKHEIPTSLLELELTETMVLENSDELLVIINKLKSLGFILSMDDFGTGYSSLNILKELPFDIIKIDRGFFGEAQASKREETILHDIVTMAHHLNMKVVSEGVETLRQSELLRSIKCDIAQGYLYARPMPVAQFLDFVRERDSSDS